MHQIPQVYACYCQLYTTSCYNIIKFTMLCMELVELGVGAHEFTQFRQFHVLGKYQKSGVPHKMRKSYTSTTTIERDSESEGSDSRPPEMLL
jgi:hypothetical protein